MDMYLMPLPEEKESLNVDEVIAFVKAIANFTYKPREDQLKQIENISNLEKLITADENGDYIVEIIFNKDCGCIQTLLKFITMCCYPHVVLHSFTIIHKCISQKRNLKGSLARRITTSFIFDEGQVLINVLLNIEDQLEYAGCPPKIINSSYLYLLSILDIACKREKKFCKYFDRYHVLKKLLYLFGKFKNSYKLSVILMDIFKCILKTRNANEFITNKTFFENLESIFTMIKNKRSPKIRNMVYLIKLLTKTEDIHESIFETKIVNYLLSILANDDNLSVSSYSVCKAIVLSINKIIKKDLFLQFFKTNANIRLLYRFCANFTVTEDKHHCILLKACSIIHACLSKRELMVDNTKCYSFPLPPNRRSGMNFTGIVSEDDDYLSTLSDDSDVEEDDDDELEDDEEEGDSEQQLVTNRDENNEDYDLRTNIDVQSQDNLQFKPLQLSTIRLFDSLKEYSQECNINNLTFESSNKLHIFDRIAPTSRYSSIYCTIASRVCAKRQFVKVAYPDMIGAESLPQPQYLITSYTKASRAKLLEIIDRAVNEKPHSNYQIVFDLDYLHSKENVQSDILTCDDLRDMATNLNTSSLRFESRFEGGNLRKAYKVGHHMYNLILAPDVNTNRKYQWFYFQVSNTRAQISYVFNIINCDKSNTQYNHGMQPVLFSVKSATQNKIGWVRTGSDIFYYRNNYTDSRKHAVYHSLSFSVRFPQSNDICYIAYHYPYSYTRLMTYLFGLQSNPPASVYLSVDTLCYSLAKNPVPLVTITAPKSTTNPIHKRKVVVLTSRVHPAESNASWAIEGTIRYLLQDDIAARQLREDYVFKIVPMQNIEGVIYGNYRCGLTTEDLNRCWRNPDAVRHPEVFYVKAMVQRLLQEYKKHVSLYLDYHGHSRRRNFFLYGCSNKASWKKSDRRLTDNIEEYMHYPTVLGDSAKALSLKSCKFAVERNRESTARVTIWREFGVKCSYTVECTYCGFDQGPYKGQAINTKHLFEIGASLMRGLWLVTSEAKRCKLSLPYLHINYKDAGTVGTHAHDEFSDVKNNN